MTILSDIAAGMDSAERRPIGLLLGISGWHAFHADAQWTRSEGSPEQKAMLDEICRLSRSQTHLFDGWDFILDSCPNPRAKRAGRRAA